MAASVGGHDDRGTHVQPPTSLVGANRNTLRRGEWGRGTPSRFFDKQNEQFPTRPSAFAKEQPWGVWGCTIFAKQPREMSWLRCARTQGGRRTPKPVFPRFEWELWNAGVQGEGVCADFSKTTIKILYATPVAGPDLYAGQPVFFIAYTFAAPGNFRARTSAAYPFTAASMSGPMLAYSRTKRGGAGFNPSMSSRTRIWPSHWALAPMPMVGMGISRVIFAASGSAMPSSTSENAPASATAFASASIAGHSACVRPWVLKPPNTWIICGVSPI